ncbi:hypothetical protein LOTGIDRAFT_168148 [Lottia gigantea]|uniref:C-type lectin domain-containing protein n=1 Tax=Lottia gigantea TaxID=225164 RepID=V3ZRD5_LOTGI|nr:hypothetical protein LOTGIDRAFT_168148 [Lottia gigantea]ESO85120.1 hypothetical protein LOTGIDRAFT_168148 [Lottia gigantea]
MTDRFVLVIILGTLVTLIQSLLLEIPDTVAQTSGSRTIRLYTDKRSWKEAQQICRDNGGLLISLETAAKREIFQKLKTEDFSSDYDRPWVGLYWTNDQTLHWDGLTACPAPAAQDVDNYNFKADGERNFKNGERCYRENNGLELRGCGGSNMFVCEFFAADGCPYVKQNIPLAYGSQVYTGVPSLDDCQAECSNNNGCFLAGTVLTRCILMYSVDSANTSVVVKNCASGSSIETSIIGGITADTTNPDECVINPTTAATTTPVPPPACPEETVTETSTETSTETTTDTSTETSTFTEHFTETSTETYTETSTEFMTETTTESYTETQTETVTETSTITNGATTVYEVSSIIISDVSTAVITVTESPSCEVTCSSSEIIESSPEYSTSSTVYVHFSSSLSASDDESDSSITTSSTFGGFLASDGTLRTQVCRDIIYVTHDPAQTQAAVNSIVNELTVEKGNLTAVVIKKISADDERPSSTVIGYAGVVFLVIPIVLMIIVDVPTYYIAAQAAVKFCKTNNH